MKILVVGKNTMLQWPQNVCDALSDMEYNYNLFLINDIDFFNDTLISLLKKFKKHSAEELLAYLFYKKIDAYKPDIIIFISAFFIPQILYNVIIKLPKKPYLIGWSGDSFNQDVIPQISLLNTLYCTDSFFVELSQMTYSLHNVHYLPLAFNPHIFSPSSIPNEQRKGIFFIGNPAQDRLEMLQKMTKPITLIGSKWGKYSLQTHAIIPKNISLNKIAEYYKSCQGILNMKQGYNVRNGLNMRSFEATACGALMIHDNVIDIKKHFISNKEILTYNTIEELNDLLTAIEKYPAQFYEIARQGMQRTLSEHSYHKRISTMLKNL